MSIVRNLTHQFRRPGILQICLSVGILLSQSTIAPSAASQDSTVLNATESQDRMIFVRVADMDGGPVADAKIELQYRVLLDSIDREFNTDTGGVAIVNYPEGTRFLMMTVHRAGFVPKMFRAGSHFGKEIPDEFRCRLARATSIGGEVRNSRDEPIAGAQVSLEMTSRSTAFNDGGSPANSLYVGEKNSPVTDSKGRWLYEGMPEDGKVTVVISHPDYAGSAGVNSPDKDQDELREKTLVTVLEDGIRIEGEVVSEQGKAISQAIVVLSQRALSTRTDSRGKFRFAVVKDGLFDIAVNTESYALELAQVDTRKNKGPVKIVLHNGIPVRFRVVDQEEKPLRARVSFSKYVDQPVPTNYLSAIPTSTNVDGFYEWLTAPKGKLKFFIFALGFETQELILAESEVDSGQIVKMTREPVFAGRVVDRKTRTPIDGFTVFSFVGGSSITRSTGVLGHGGKFTLPMSRIDERFSNFHLMIEHTGHRTVLTEKSYDRTTPTDKILIEMDTADPVFGAVVDSKGRATADAKLTISETSTGMFSLPPMQLGMLMTDDAGSFRFPAPPGDFAILVRCEAGYFHKTYRQNDADLGKLQLYEWGRVKGQVVQKNGRPSVNSFVRIIPAGKGFRNLVQSTLTDEFGNFQFDQIHAEACTLSINPSKDANGKSSNPVSKKIKVEAGKEFTETITLN